MGVSVHSPQPQLEPDAEAENGAPPDPIKARVRARAMTRPTNGRAQDAPPNVHHGQYSLSLIETLSHPRQARKNKVQRWQLSLRAGAYR